MQVKKQRATFFFYKIIITFFFLLLLPLSGHSENIRGVWVVRHNMNNAALVDQFLEFSQRYGFTDLFVQVRGRGDAFYESAYEPLAESVAPGFDPLAYLMQQNEKYSFRIHAWVNVFYFWSSNKLPLSETHLLHQKPEWIVYPIHHDSSATPDSLYQNRRNAEGLYLSPLLPEVRAHLVNVVMDILKKYPVHGIHLDYIRFPGHHYDYTPLARAEFKKKYYLDPLDFQGNPNKFVENFGQAGYQLFYERWAQFQRDGLSEFVRMLAGHVHFENPTLILSAAVKPDLEKAHWEFFQEWDRWLKEGWLDWALPMNYTPDGNRFARRMETIAHRAHSGKILMGVALYNQSPTSALEKILAVENSAFMGYTLFSYDQLIKDKKLEILYKNHISKSEVKP